MIPQQAINIERHLVQNILYHLEKCHDIQKHQVTEDVLIYIYIYIYLFQDISCTRVMCHSPQLSCLSV